MSPRPMTVSVEALLVHADFVRALARSLLADKSAADDVVQDTWLAALRTPPREISRSWFATVVRNFARQNARGETHRRAREECGARGERVASVDEIAEREAVRAELVRAVLALSEPTRTAMLMRFYDGRSPGEIARATNVPVETVRTRIKRGLARLREDLGESRGTAWMGALAPLAAYDAKVAGATVLASSATKIGAVAAATALLFVLWCTNRAEPPPATSIAAGDEASARDSTDELDPKEPMTGELHLSSAPRTAVAVGADTSAEKTSAAAPADCATIDVRVSTGKRVDEVSGFSCRFLRLSDSAQFGAQAVGTQLSYCLPLDRARDEVIVSVTDARFGTASARARVSYGRHAQVHLRLPGNGKLCGFVLDEKREPIADAWVFSGTLQRMRDERSTDLFEPLEIDRVNDAVITDANGAFELFVRDGCVTAWHDEHTSATVSADDATCIVMRARGELQLQILDDAAQPWARGSITLDGGRSDTADLLGRVFLADVELGAHGVALPDRRLVGITHASPNAREIVVGPWITAVSIGDPRFTWELNRADGEGTLVGTAREAFSIVALHKTQREVTIDAILPGPYTLVTKNGSFTKLHVDAEGAVVVQAASQAWLRVEAPMGEWVYVTPEVAHEHVDRVCRLVNGQMARGREPLSWSAIPPGRWRVVREGACEPTIVDVKERGQTVTLR